ncbi:MAG: alpha-galactosidase [bacterium]|nr:alpha-galactosidase [bacterium]
MDNTTEGGLRFEDGQLLIDTPWAKAVPGDVLVNNEPVRGAWESDEDGAYTCRCGPWRLALSQPEPGLVACTVHNNDDVPRRLDKLILGRWTPEAFDNALRSEDFREFVHGGSFRNIGTGVKIVGRKTAALDFAAPSNMVTVYAQVDALGGERAALLLGVAPPIGDGFSEFTTIHSDPHCEASFGFEIAHIFECEVRPGESVAASPVVTMTGPSGVDLLDALGALWRERLERKPAKERVRGWNSWDAYSGAVSRAAIDENIEAAQSLFGNTVQVFGIDEGWEVQWGDWRPNAKFPEGLEDYCDHVKSRGCTPGIWTAPLLVNTYNPLFLEKPEWFARDASGQIRRDTYSYGPMAYLDPTQPEVIDHVAGIFTRLREAGFEYFKVDFCHCILQAERFADPSVSRLGLNRRVFAAIRQAIGENAYLLSCGAPYESVAGLVDAVRTSGDIHIYWGHVLANAGAIAGRSWMQDRLWNCDPDFLVVRGPDTAEPPFEKDRVVQPLGPEGGWNAGREFNEAEARAYALLVHLSGGDTFLGDALPKLNETGVDILRKTLEPRDVPALPADMFTSDQDLPRVWISRDDSDVLVGLFNWSDKPACVHFDPAECGLTGVPSDFWTDARVKHLPDRVPRRSAIGLRYPSSHAEEEDAADNEGKSRESGAFWTNLARAFKRLKPRR